MSTTRVSLIQRVSNPEDQEAWEEFFTLYEPVLVSYVHSNKYSRNLHGQDVDELVQMVLIKLFRALPEFALDKSRGRFRTFLYRVTSNAIVDYLRSRNRQPHAQGELFEAASSDQPDEDWDPLYLGAILDRAAEQLKAEIFPRNPTQWCSFEEQCLKGRPAKDVAADLGVSVDLIYQNSSRVMKKMQQLCRSLYQEDFSNDD